MNKTDIMHTLENKHIMYIMHNNMQINDIINYTDILDTMEIMEILEILEIMEIMEIS